ncbi:MAG: hypothetical protein ACR2OV_06300 [Hyphomicrobiaceae bacterium]
MDLTEIFADWKRSLRRLLDVYDAHRGPLHIFYPTLFVFFVFLNIACYWWAMLTAFPFLINAYYFKTQFPVGILGALFDSLSFFVTIYIVRRALEARSNTEYAAHLSIDLVIAILATIWVVYVFTVSGWIVKWFEATPDNLAGRALRYEQMVIDAAANPADNLRNIYFGLVMGVSAMIPTTVHFGMFILSVWKHLSRKRPLPE